MTTEHTQPCLLCHWADQLILTRELSECEIAVLTAPEADFDGLVEYTTIGSLVYQVSTPLHCPIYRVIKYVKYSLEVFRHVRNVKTTEPEPVGVVEDLDQRGQLFVGLIHHQHRTRLEAEYRHKRDEEESIIFTKVEK